MPFAKYMFLEIVIDLVLLFSFFFNFVLFILFLKIIFIFILINLKSKFKSDKWYLWNRQPVLWSHTVGKITLKQEGS